MLWINVFFAFYFIEINDFLILLILKIVNIL